MIVSVRKIAQRFKLILLFVALTVCLYQLLALAQPWIKPVDRYREPTGRAVKVFRDEAVREEQLTMGERLKRFYWYGQ
ncbi:DUF4227 family protein [Paenibacillus aurantius]|uniref:DUF4227 family protein n=1 Tax=Paenibacillus aurantius TaxID=2918900 RepID=A0AA96L9W2_9BACL|nr:DUF4227 family protein [Paenibacillus aurantius]WJH34262.1 YqzK family protein [Paenibacillus sp. CC-CFT747]WNQ09360.1 DUF4227 family protein [Paenibacillus aurantius]